MRLHLEQGRTGRPGTLNLRPAEKVFTLLTGVAALALGMSVIRWSLPWLIVAGLCLAVVIVGNCRCCGGSLGNGAFASPFSSSPCDSSTIS
jgi:hypothetical protein